MGYVTYDSSGNQVASGGTSSGGGGSFIVPFGHYWNTAGVAGTFSPFVNVLQNLANAGSGLANATWPATMAGVITNVGMYEAGPANGQHSVQIMLNGSTVQTVTVGIGGNGTYLSAPCNVPFNAGDKITAAVANSVAGNSQVQCTFTMKLSG